MGLLANLGQAIGGAGVPGSGDAAALGRAGLGYGAGATLLNTAGSLMEGIGGAQQANYAAQVAGQNYKNSLTAGQEQESASKMKFGELESAQKAAFAGNGVGIGGENVRTVVQHTADIGAIDAALIHYNSAREAWGNLANEQLAKSAQRNSLIKGFLGAGASFLGGASALTGKALAFKQYGVGGGSGGLTVPTASNIGPLADPSLSSYIPGMAG